MLFLIILLTLALVLNSAILVLLVLIQLPKKEAGGVLAFGASGADALFGAGSGTMLTKVTKYAASAFFVLAIILSLLQSAYHNRGSSGFQSTFGKTPQTQAPPAGSPSTAPSTPAPQSTPGSLTATSAFPQVNTSAPAVLLPAESSNVPAPTNAPTPTAPK